MKMFCEMSRRERRRYMLSSLSSLKKIREYGGPHGLATAYSKRAHEERFRKLWKNRHREDFDFNIV